MEIKNGGEGWWEYWGQHRTTGSICMTHILDTVAKDISHKIQGTHTGRVSQLLKLDKNLSGVCFKTELPVT